MIRLILETWEWFHKMCVRSNYSKFLVLAAFSAGFLGTQVARAGSMVVVYSFKGGNDGATPTDTLIRVGKTLYGTTLQGGTGTACAEMGGQTGCGTVFSVTPSGVEKVIYSFQAGYDGYYPIAGLTYVGGTFYGTALRGGQPPSGIGYGIVFSVTPSGSESVLHAFGSGNDGASPNGGLINASGALHGTTVQGGGHSPGGTVFKITTTGSYSPIYNFGTNGGNDGVSPLSKVIDIGGKLYGTTCAGGTYNGGTVFVITKAGTEKVLHSFNTSDGDGICPSAGLIEVNGILYGTAHYGGKAGPGAIFSITPAGLETVVYSFGEHDGDGGGPTGDLININGTLYGTTSGYPGTVFSVTPGGFETVVYAFRGGSDGCIPDGGLLNVDGVLYGTTQNCGINNAGTVFSVTP